MKPFKIKAIKTCKSHSNLSYSTQRARANIIRKWYLYKNCTIKTSLFIAKLYYNDFMRLFLLRQPRNLEAQRISCTAKEAKATGM